MSEHSSSSDKPATNETITLIKNELNFIRGETHKARKFLASSLVGFTGHANTINARLDRIKKLLLGTLPIDEEEETKDENPAIEEPLNGQSNEISTKTDSKAHSKYVFGEYDEQAINETTTKIIANSKPDRVQGESKQPERVVPETKQEPAATKKPTASTSTKARTARKPSEVRANFPNLKPKKSKSSEALYEQDSDIEEPREVNLKLPNKTSKSRKGKSNAEKASAIADDQRNDRQPSKKKRKASETDEEKSPVPEEPKAKKAKKERES
jgi:hypothetical protein